VKVVWCSGRPAKPARILQQVDVAFEYPAQVPNGYALGAPVIACAARAEYLRCGDCASRNDLVSTVWLGSTRTYHKMSTVTRTSYVATPTITGITTLSFPVDQRLRRRCIP